MKRTIVFLSGLGVPKILAKTPWCWQDDLWSDYNRIYYTSKLPKSDIMVQKKLNNLIDLTHKYSGSLFVGQSLGAWWLANLASCPEAYIKKMALWTPLADHNDYNIFNATRIFNPLNRERFVKGPAKVLVLGAKDDWITPGHQHANRLASFFQATHYLLDGGHYYQKNHEAGLQFMKDWFELI
jgi:predicted alpha/beta hydrolase family esterase